MESANLHHQHHQLQDLQLVQSSPLSTPFCYGGVGSLHAWTPNNTILNDSGNFINTNTNGAMVNPRDPKQQNDILVPSLNSSMIQDLGFHWVSPAGSFTAHDLQLARIKQELPEFSYPKFTEMMNTPSSTIEDLHLNYMKNEQRNLNDLSEFYSNAQNCSSRGSFSQIFPTVNISNFNNQSTTKISSSLDMNLEALDLFNSARFSGSFSPPSDHHLGVFKDSYSNYGLDHMQQLSHRPSYSPSKVSPFTTGVTEAKRPICLMEPKAPQVAPKKSRLDSRVSCPPLKVRKEKLGDRIAALQQLVAPFGKTDTASVLMEAIGYIKFLQNQVETLSVPYMKSSRNKTSRTMQGGSREDGVEEAKQDLRSRGLCLVPLSCLSYVTDGGGGVWPPSTFSGGT